jgi:hypothetical protein
MREKMQTLDDFALRAPDFSCDRGGVLEVRDMNQVIENVAFDSPADV